MARIEQKSPATDGKGSSTLNKVFFYIGVGLLSAIAVFLIVILVLWLVGKDKKDKEEEFEPTYTSSTIGFDKLERIFNNELTSGENSEFIYVYIYSPDYETYELGAEERIQKAIKSLSDAKLKNDVITFYVFNVEDKDNKKDLEEHPDFFTNYDIDSTWPCLVEIGGSTEGMKINHKYTTKNEIITVAEKLVKENVETEESTK